MPLADARLLAMDELKSRGGRRRGCWKLGGFRRGEEERGPRSDFEARSSATAADVDNGFSLRFCNSGSAAVAGGFSEGCRSKSASLRWCCSNSRNVLKASALLVPDAALANSPAARACSLMATVVSEL